MRDKYGVNQDVYCYPNSDVLVNKLNIDDHAGLAEAELAFTAARYSEYSSNVSSINQFNLSHLKNLHFHLFQDVYSWAGDLRTVDISKEEWIQANIKGYNGCLLSLEELLSKAISHS